MHINCIHTINTMSSSTLKEVPNNDKLYPDVLLLENLLFILLDDVGDHEDYFPQNYKLSGSKFPSLSFVSVSSCCYHFFYCLTEGGLSSREWYL